jgi:hypothetical protein
MKEKRSNNVHPQERGCGVDVRAEIPDLFRGNRPEVDLTCGTCEVVCEVLVNARLAKCVQAFCFGRTLD